jgi:Fe-Mn family superoxide dismutase
MLSVARNVFRPTLTRAFAVPSGRAFKHTLPPLPYAYNVSSVFNFQLFGELVLTIPPKALEPYISEEIMRLHHTKHHQTYVNGLNAAEDAYKKADSTAKQIALQPALKFNGGGLYTFFFLFSYYIDIFFSFYFAVHRTY